MFEYDENLNKKNRINKIEMRNIKTIIESIINLILFGYFSFILINIFKKIINSESIISLMFVSMFLTQLLLRYNKNLIKDNYHETVIFLSLILLSTVILIDIL